MRIARQQAGFTLIELLIVVTVISILAGIAIPSYRQHVMKVKRTEAKTALTGLATKLERCYTRSNRYDDRATCPLTTTFLSEPEGFYQITSTINEQSFTLTAAPQGAQGGDAKCMNFGLTEKGVQTVTGTSPPKDCW